MRKVFTLCIALCIVPILFAAETPVAMRMTYFQKYNGGGVTPAQSDFFFPFPELEMADGKIQIPHRISQNREEAFFDFPCGAKMRVGLAAPGSFSVKVTSAPAEARRVRQTATIPFKSYVDGAVILGFRTARLGERQGVVTHSRTESEIGVYHANRNGCRVAVSGNDGAETEIRLQDNRAWNWETFQLFLIRPLTGGQAEFTVGMTAAPMPEKEKTVLVDRFGQSTKIEFPGKIHDEKEFADRKKADDDYYDNLKPPADFDRYGGLAGSGRKYGLKPTGFFRTAKAGNRDVLVTPEGNVFFMISAAALGMCDTITKVEGREDIFEWLPVPGQRPFQSAFYIDGKHVSFYKTNLIRKYGGITDAEWAKRFTERLKKWGFNSFGPFNSIRAEDYPAEIPYTVVLTPPEKFNVVRLTFDPFDPEAVEKIESYTRKRMTPHIGNPYLIGYYLNNEQPLDEISYQIPRKKGSVAAKRELVRMLEKKYGTVDSFNRSWGTAFHSFAELNDAELAVNTPDAKRDMRNYSNLFLDKYFQVITGIVRHLDPDHLILGMRYMPHTVTPDVARIASKYIDVFSVNYYTHSVDTTYLRDMHGNSGKPMLLSEWSFGDKSRGLAGGVRNTADQKERGLAYRNYIEQTASLPFVVGSCYFQCVDQPLTGRWIRGYDDERFNCGLVDVTDQPYREFLDKVMASHARIYRVMLGETAPFQLDLPAYRAGTGKRFRKELTIPRAVAPMTVNGSIADWPQLPSQGITAADLTDGVSPQGNRADFRACFDSKNLYLDIKIADPTPLRNLREGDKIWLGDSIELFFGSRETGKGGEVLPTDLQLVIACRENGPPEYLWYNNAIPLPGRKIPVRIGNLPGTGYEVQLAIPLDVLGIRPDSGTRFLFDIGFGDSEDGLKRARQFIWSGNERNARNRDFYSIATLAN